MKSILSASLLVLAFVSLAGASPIVCATNENLQQIIDAGGCTYGDLLFNNVVYQDNVIAGSPSTFTASQVTVVMGTPNVISINAGWSTRGSQHMQIVFNYTVTSTNAPITALSSNTSPTGPNATYTATCTSGCPGSPLDFTNPSNPNGVALVPEVAAGTPINIHNLVNLGASAIGTVNHVSIISNQIFEGTASPEPGTIGLLFAGAMALAGARFYKKA